MVMAPGLAQKYRTAARTNRGLGRLARFGDDLRALIVPCETSAEASNQASRLLRKVDGRELCVLGSHIFLFRDSRPFECFSAVLRPCAASSGGAGRSRYRFGPGSSFFRPFVAINTGSTQTLLERKHSTCHQATELPTIERSLEALRPRHICILLRKRPAMEAGRCCGSRAPRGVRRS